LPDQLRQSETRPAQLLVECGPSGKGEAGAREAGRLRLEGKDYVVREGDVMHFRFNV